MGRKKRFFNWIGKGVESNSKRRTNWKGIAGLTATNVLLCLLVSKGRKGICDRGRGLSGGILCIKNDWGRRSANGFLVGGHLTGKKGKGERTDWQRGGEPPGRTAALGQGNFIIPIGFIGRVSTRWGRKKSNSYLQEPVLTRGNCTSGEGSSSTWEEKKKNFREEAGLLF